MSQPAAERLKVVERRLAMLQEDVAGVRRELFPEPPAVVESPAPVNVPTPAPPPVVPMAPPGMPPAASRPAIWPPPTPVAPGASPPRPARPTRREIDLLSPGALAWAGGIALLLGVVFFFVMAVSRGWVSPEMRVAFGGLLSMGLVGTGIMLRSRVGEMAAATVAAGAGLATAFVTVVASSRIYGFVDPAVGMGLALVVAAAGGWLAHRWDDEAFAGFGLVGAIATAPIVEAGITTTSCWFVLIAMGAAALLWIERGWLNAAAVAVAGALPQVIWLAAENNVASPTLELGSVAPAGVIAVVAVAWLSLLASGIASHLRGGRDELSQGTLGALGLGLATAVFGNLMLFAHGVPGADPQGIVFIVLACVYGFLAAGLHRGGGAIAGVVLGATAVAMFAAGVGELTSGAGRVAAFAAQGALLAWLAMRLREPRMRIAAVAELGLAVAFTLAQHRPAAFFSAGSITLSETAALWCVAAGLAVAAWASREEPWFDRAFGVGAGAVLYALSFSILGVMQRGSGSDFAAVEGAFQRGHTVVSVTWGLLGLAGLVIGLRRSERWIRMGGLGLLVLSLGKLVLFDLANLDAMARALSFLLVGGVLIAAAAMYAKLGGDDDGVADIASEATAVSPTP